MRIRNWLLTAGLGACLLAGNAGVSRGEETAGVVSHVKVLSGNIEDVSSLEAWKASFIKPGMSDQEKALAVWQSAVMFRHQDIPPREFASNEPDVHDPIKSFNVYGYGQCCCASAHIEALSRYIGLPARGWGIVGHSVPEVSVGGQWCMLDSSLINYFTKPDGSIASLGEISKSIEDWYAAHPQFRGDNDKLVQFMRSEGWKNGPSIVAGSHFYDENGWLPAATHGWYSTMSEFGSASKNFIYEYGSAIGYEVNIQLRPGEKLARNWSNKGLHVNMLDGDAPGCLNKKIGTEDLRYSPRFGDLAPGRVGNGTLEYDLPLAGGAFRSGMLQVENLASSDGSGTAAALSVKDASKAGVLVFRMPCSYVYLSGTLDLDAVVGKGGSIEVELSNNNGVDFKPVGKIDASGTRHLDLKPLVFRRYDYRLRLTLHGDGIGLNRVHVTHDIQHSQRPLPALEEGANHISFSEGAQEGTITINPSTNPEFKGKNAYYTDYHPQLKSIADPNLRVQNGAGEVIFPIQTPGDMTRLRVGAHYRARDKKDGWQISASFDGGKTWKPVGALEGPYGGFSKYFVFTDVPASSRSALVRFSGVERNTTLILDLRIDADYKEPRGGFAPVKVTYRWEENGQVHQDIHVSAKPDESYEIQCAGKPVMKSIVLERPGESR